MECRTYITYVDPVVVRTMERERRREEMIMIRRLIRSRQSCHGGVSGGDGSGRGTHTRMIKEHRIGWKELVDCSCDPAAAALNATNLQYNSHHALTMNSCIIKSLRRMR